MGGKIWTAAEEDVFWTQIVPQSYHRLGADRTANPGRDWDVLGRAMRDAMRQYYQARGEEIPRNYTGQSLYEHWDRNVHKGPSRHARQYVEAYHAQAAADGNPIERRRHRIKKSSAKVPPNADETDLEDHEHEDSSVVGRGRSTRPLTSGSGQVSPSTIQDRRDLDNSSSNNEESDVPRPAKRRRARNRRVNLDQNHPRLARRREELLRPTRQEQDSSANAGVPDALSSTAAHLPNHSTSAVDRHAIMPPMTYGEFEDRVTRQVESRLAEVITRERAHTRRDIDERLCGHLASFSALVAGTRATEAGAHLSRPSARPATEDRAEAARHPLPSIRPVLRTTATDIPLIFPPSTPFFGGSVAASTPAQVTMPTISVLQPANDSSDGACNTTAPDGSPEAPITVPSISDEE